MAEVTEASDVTLRDIFMQLNGIKRDFDSSFGDLRQDIQTTRIELQRDIKIIRDEVDEFKKWEKLKKQSVQTVQDLKLPLTEGVRNIKNRRSGNMWWAGSY